MELCSGNGSSNSGALNAAGSHGVHQGALMILVFVGLVLSLLGRNSPIGGMGGPRGVEMSKQVRLGETAQHPLFYSYPKTPCLKVNSLRCSYHFFLRLSGHTYHIMSCVSCVL